MATNADNIRKLINAEAGKHGYELAHTDLRMGLVFLRKQGTTEVLGAGSWRCIDPRDVPTIVRMVIRGGQRVDQVKGSRYYVGS